MKTQKTTTLLPFPALALLSVVLLSACGPEGDFEDAINAALEDRKKMLEHLLIPARNFPDHGPTWLWKQRNLATNPRGTGNAGHDRT